ncbi:hypothetical protein GQ53DRAFT_657284 [Thozetella sp. PMI_491]|nr:hypothetical protein GQ53DRAFT_657284 [Thozetella sp. PMI_491]
MILPSMQHHPHHQQQGQAPQHIQQHPRPSSIVHQHHQAPPPPQQQHHSAYSAQHQVYQHPAQAQAANQQHAQDLPQYYAPHPSPYSTPGANSGYTSAEAGEMMAATMPRPPYPPMSYHTPQSNSPASVASPSGHDQQRSMYGQPTSQLHQQPMYYGQQAQYSSMPTQAAASPYAQHAQQPHQQMNPQQNMMMQHPGQHQMSQHQSQHQQAMPSPRHTKIEAHPQQMQQRAPAPGPLGPQQTSQSSAPLPTPTGSAPGGVNSNAAPGPIPATTPLVVRQDQNGVQWIAFEYSRDRVKMEYTIRCDVESVNTDELSPEFKSENCVYPRACCPKDQYRGNRLQYETECNTVGWALAQLNAPLRGKRGLIQRAVDSWRNSNQDPRLRSRRVRRQAKMGTRKAVSASPHPSHLAGPTGPAGMPNQGMPGGPGGMGKPGMNGMGSQMHHGAQGGGDEVGDGEYMDDQQHHHHHHQAPSGSDERPAHVFPGYNNYPASVSGPMSSVPDSMGGSGAIPAATRRSSVGRNSRNDEPEDLFPDIPEAKKRKFILVEDSDRQSRLRVRVTLEGVDTREIPDSFRKGSSVFPRSYFPREMQSPPPSATGSKFFPDDTSDAEDDGAVETEGRRTSRGSSGGSRGKAMVKVPLADGQEGEVAIPRMRKGTRGKEVRLNDLGYRMAWLQSRVFAGRTVFLQRALDCYRNKTRSAIEQVMQDVKTAAPHYETRPGKRRWGDRMRRGEKKDDE